MKLKAISAAILAGSTTLGVSFASAQDVVDASFFPYNDSVPTHDGLSVGMTISSSNVAQFKDVIDPAIYQFIESMFSIQHHSPQLAFYFSERG